MLSWTRPACSSPQRPGLGLLCSGCLPLWLSPQSHSAPYIPSSWPQPDSSPNSWLAGAGGRESPRSVCQSPTGLSLTQPYFPCPETTPFLNTNTRWAWGGARKAVLLAFPPPPRGPGHRGPSAPCPSPPVWLATQNHSTLVTERSAVPFLPVNPEYSATRNQVSGLDRGGGGWGDDLPSWGHQLYGSCPSWQPAVWAESSPLLAAASPWPCWLWDLGMGRRLFFGAFGEQPPGEVFQPLPESSPRHPESVSFPTPCPGPASWSGTF